MRSDKVHVVDGSLCPTLPGSTSASFVVRRCPVFRDIKTIISLARRDSYFSERQNIHSSSNGCDEILIDIIHMRRFDWTKCCMDIATPMFRLRHVNLTKLAIVNRIILDKHFETNVGKREGSPHLCPLCNDGNLNIFHVLQCCPHGVVSHVRYTHTLSLRAASVSSDGSSFEEGVALLDILRTDSMAANLLRGIVPYELFDRIRADPRLRAQCEGTAKTKFMRFLALIGSRSSAVCASFFGSLYEARGNILPRRGSGINVLRRANGSLVGRRRKLPNLFTMAQFKPPKKPLTIVPIVHRILVSTVLSAESECGTYRLSVDFSMYEDMISPQLMIDDLHPGGLLLSNITLDAYTIQVNDPRGSRLLASYGSDTGYSGYAMLHSVLGDQEVIDMADARLLKVMRVFVTSLREMTCCPSLKEELDCVLSYMKGIEGCTNRSLPESRGLWLGPLDIRDIAGTDNIFIWVYEPGCRMEYISSEKVTLSCVSCLDGMDHVISYRRMFMKFDPPTQTDLAPLLEALSYQLGLFLRAHLASSQSLSS